MKCESTFSSFGLFALLPPLNKYIMSYIPDPSGSVPFNHTFRVPEGGSADQLAAEQEVYFSAPDSVTHRSLQ